MRIALLADVHANLPALEAVIEEAERRKVDHYAVLGDLVGYNAQPRQCVELIRSLPASVVAGNHDRGVTEGSTEAGTNETAQNVVRWTRAQLDDECVAYLRALPNVLIDPEGLLLAHGCFLNDIFYRGYVTSTMLETNLRTIASNSKWPKIACCGHTHVAMMGWLEDGVTTEQGLDRPRTWPKRADSIIINPGSVGQPRDGDPRASFALIDMEARHVEACRVIYDLTVATNAIRAAGLSTSLADRLLEGR